MIAFPEFVKPFSKLATGRVRSRCAPTRKHPAQTAIRRAKNACPNDSASDRPTSAATLRVIFTPDAPPPGPEFGNSEHSANK